MPLAVWPKALTFWSKLHNLAKSVQMKSKQLFIPRFGIFGIVVER